MRAHVARGQLATITLLMCWADLAAILRDCEESRVLSDVERALAANALAWLAEVGIVPTAERWI